MSSSGPVVSSVVSSTQSTTTSSLNGDAAIFVSNLAKSKKRKANTKGTPKSSEDAEIAYLKIELNAVRTQAIQLEVEKVDLKRKNGILSEVIKMHEQRETNRAYSSLFPGTHSPPHTAPEQQRQPHKPYCQPSCHTLCCPPPSHRQHQHYHCQTCQGCYSESVQGHPTTLPHCNSTKDNASPPPLPLQESLKLLTELSEKVAKLQDEVVDIVNKVEVLCGVNTVGQNDSLSSPHMTDTHSANKVSETKSSAPLFRNPRDIPDYDTIEVIAAVDVHEVPAAESIVSIDDFVPDIPLMNNNKAFSLNYHAQTNQSI